MESEKQKGEVLRALLESLGSNLHPHPYSAGSNVILSKEVLVHSEPQVPQIQNRLIV